MAFFPLEDIENIIDEDVRNDKIEEILDTFKPDDPPFLSNVILHAGENEAVHLMEILAGDNHGFVWKIRFLRDEWGQSKQPGDYVTRSIPKNRTKRNGDLVDPHELSLARKDGSYSRKFENLKKFRLDSKLCFECGYDDAVYFLNNWGYNRKTSTAVTKKREYSMEPVDMRDPSKGKKVHVRYWRYAEIDKEDYQNLPIVETESTPKKGK